jgi:large subunit ribosomal protein L13
VKTFSPKPRDIERRWYVIDAQGAVLGRLASEVAKILRGKHKPIFAPHADTGDHVIVVNARGVRLTGTKEQAKVFYHHSGYPGGLRRIGYARLMAERPSFAVEKAVRGMLPKNRLGRQMIKKLAVYEGSTHPHKAQRPESLELGRTPKWEGLPKPAVPPAPAPRSTRPSRRASSGGAGEAAAPTGGRSASAGASRRAKPRTAPARARASSARKTAPAGAGANTSRARSSAPAAAKAKRATRAAGTETEKKPPRTRRRKSTTKES